MEFLHVSDISGFFQRVIDCEGSVYFIDHSGGKRDLKSIATQFGQLLPYISEGAIKSLQVIAAEPKDSQKLIRFMSQMNYKP